MRTRYFDILSIKFASSKERLLVLQDVGVDCCLLGQAVSAVNNSFWSSSHNKSYVMQCFQINLERVLSCGQNSARDLNILKRESRDIVRWFITITIFLQYFKRLNSHHFFLFSRWNLNSVQSGIPHIFMEQYAVLLDLPFALLWSAHLDWAEATIYIVVLLTTFTFFTSYDQAIHRYRCISPLVTWWITIIVLMSKAC